MQQHVRGVVLVCGRHGAAADGSRHASLRAGLRLRHREAGHRNGQHDRRAFENAEPARRSLAHVASIANNLTKTGLAHNVEVA